MLFINKFTACKLICSLCFVVVLAELETQQLVRTWEDTFATIFGDIDTASIMSDRQLLQSMMFLYDTARHVDPGTLNATQVKTVEYWYVAIIDDKIEHCSPEQLLKMRAVFEEHNQYDNPNFKEVFKTSRKNTMEFCSEQFKDLPAKLLAKNVSEVSLMTLFNDYTREVGTYSVEDLASVLKIPVTEMLGNKRLSGHKLVKAWINGPCTRILNLLDEPEMKSYSDFVEMSLLSSRRALQFCPESLREWLLLVDMCRELDTVIPEMAKNSSPSKSALHKIKKCFTSCS